MEEIHKRLKAELARLGLTAAAAARAAGESDSQSLRDALGGRKRVSAEMLAALMPAGVDVVYVLSGQTPGMTLSTDETVFVQMYRAAPTPAKSAALGALMGAQQSPGQVMSNLGSNNVQMSGGGSVNIGAPKPARKRVTKTSK